METYHPAAAMGLVGYGVEPGCWADLVLLNGSSAAEAVLGRANRRYVFRRGRLIAENRQESFKHY